MIHLESKLHVFEEIEGSSMETIKKVRDKIIHKLGAQLEAIIGDSDNESV